MNLEIIVITYNRAVYLKSTLNMIAESRLVKCKITVLDNASRDETPLICNSFKDIFPIFNVIRHNHNIGLGGNIIRALELGTAVYTWVLCDDDVLDFSIFDDVEKILSKGEVDLIHVGGHSTKPWSFGGRLGNIKELYKEGYPYFKYSSFLPTNIFKTDKFQSSFLIAGYANVVNAYPHMPYLLSMYEEDALIYISKARIVTARETGQSYSENNWYRWWACTCELLKMPGDVRTAFFDQWRDIENGNDKICLDSVYDFVKNRQEGSSDYIEGFIHRYFNASDKAYLASLSISNKSGKIGEFIFAKRDRLVAGLKSLLLSK